MTLEKFEVTSPDMRQICYNLTAQFISRFRYIRWTNFSRQNVTGLSCMNSFFDWMEEFEALFKFKYHSILKQDPHLKSSSG